MTLGGEVPGADVVRVLRGEAILAGIAGRSADHHATHAVLQVAIEAVGQDADRYSGAGKPGDPCRTADQVAALGEVPLRGHRPRLGNHLGSAYKTQLRQLGGGDDLVDGQPTADGVGIHRSLLKPKPFQRTAQSLNITIGNGVHQHQRHGSACT